MADKTMVIPNATVRRAWRMLREARSLLEMAYAAEVPVSMDEAIALVRASTLVRQNKRGLQLSRETLAQSRAQVEAYKEHLELELRRVAPVASHFVYDPRKPPEWHRREARPGEKAVTLRTEDLDQQPDSDDK